MEKLVELLNEFNKEKIPKEFKEILPDELEYTCMDFFLTKEAGFIERLVKNDKIDFDNVRETNYGWEFNYYWTIPNSKRDKEIQVERLLMILSIQDNPIEFLISILK